MTRNDGGMRLRRISNELFISFISCSALFHAFISSIFFLRGGISHIKRVGIGDNPLDT